MRLTACLLASTILSIGLDASGAAAQSQASVRSVPDQATLTLPGQTLTRTLDAITSHYGVSLEFQRPATDRFRAAPVVDAKSAEDALTQALANTGLSVSRSADGRTLGIGRPDPGRLADDIIVTAPRNEAEVSYKADTSATGTRTGTSLRVLPQSATIITAEVLKDQQAQTIDDALRNVGSAAVSLSNVQGAQTFRVRGFGAQVTSNGVAVPAGAYQPIDAIERVEVLKGPAAILQGEGSLGGVVNVVNKRPTTTTIFDVSLQAGSFDEYKGTIDASTALDAGNRFSARMIGSGFRQGRTYGGYDGGRQLLISPSLRYKDSALDLTVGVTRSELRQPFQAYTQFSADNSGLLDRPQYAIGFRNAAFSFGTTNAFAEGTYTFAPWLMLFVRGSRTWLDQEQIYFSPFNRASREAPTIAGIETGFDNRFKTWTGDTYLRAKFQTGPLRHTVSGGFNLRYTNFHGDNYVADDANFGFVPAFDVLNGAPLPDFEDYSVDPQGSSASTDKSRGFYLQDLIEVGPLHVFGALRRNLFSSRFSNVFADTSYKSSAWTPSGGAVLDLTTGVSIYGSYSKGFNPGNARRKSGELLPPVQASNIEAGAKFDLNKNKALLTVAAFQNRQKNLAQADPTDFNFFVLAGGLQTRGVEAELSGEVLPNLVVSASATRSWYKQIFQELTFEASPYVGLPKTKASFWGVYTVPSGPLAKLGIGAGVFQQSGSPVQVASEFGPALRVPGYVRGDISLFYSRGPLDFTLGIRNVTDERDYGESSSPTFVAILPPRTVRLTVTFHGFR